MTAQLSNVLKVKAFMIAWRHASWVGVKYILMFACPAAALGGIALWSYKAFGAPALWVFGVALAFFFITSMVAQVEFYEDAKEKIRARERELENAKYIESKAK